MAALASRGITVLHIEGNSIENLNQETRPRGKSWVAVVERDVYEPGGLRRDFLERAPGGRAFLPDLLPEGGWLEFAGDFYTAKGMRKPSRKYFRILAHTETELRLEPCPFEDVGKIDDSPPANPLEGFTDEEILAEARRRRLV